MKYHEDSPLNLSEESKNKTLIHMPNSQVVINESIAKSKQQIHQETPIISPRQAIEKHDKIIQELSQKKKQLADNNLLLEAAMKAAMVVPN